LQNLAQNLGAIEEALPPSLLEAESLLRNHNPRNVVAPLRVAQAALEHPPAVAEETARQIQVALRLQKDWEGLLRARELVRSEIQRGKECLEQVRYNLENLRRKMADWPAYERICGYNPLAEYMKRIDAKERILQFLPGWLEQREQQLANLTRKIEDCAHQNGLEHLL